MRVIHQEPDIAPDLSVNLGDGIWQVKDLVEKPPRSEAPSDLAIIGRYILTPDIFPALAATKSTGGAAQGDLASVQSGVQMIQQHYGHVNTIKHANLALHGMANWEEGAYVPINRWGAVQALGVPHSNMIHMTNWLTNGMPER